MPTVVNKAPLLAIIFLVMFNLWLYSFGYRLTADDALFLKISISPLSSQLEWITETAASQGRIGQYASLLSNIIGSHFSDWIIARWLFVAIYFLNYIIFAYYIGVIARKPSLFPYLSLGFILMSPLLFKHTTPNAYPLQNTIPFIMIIFSRIILNKSNDAIYVKISRMIFLSSMFFMEYSILFAASILIIEYGMQAWSTGGRGLKNVLQSRNLQTDAMIVAIGISSYLGYRLFFPSSYDGNSADGIFNIQSTAQVALLHTITSTVFPWVGRSAITWESILAASLVATAAGTIAASLNELQLKLRDALVLLTLMSASAMVVVMPIAAGVKFQEWCILYKECTYLSSRSAYFFFVPFLLILIILPMRSKMFRIATFAIIGACNVTANWETASQMQNKTYPYRLVWDRACDGLLPTQADPDERVSYHPGLSREEFWSDYIAYVKKKKGC